MCHFRRNACRNWKPGFPFPVVLSHRARPHQTHRFRHSTHFYRKVRIFLVVFTTVSRPQKQNNSIENRKNDLSSPPVDSIISVPISGVWHRQGKRIKNTKEEKKKLPHSPLRLSSPPTIASRRSDNRRFTQRCLH